MKIIIEFSILLLFYGIRSISVMIILACLLTIDKFDFTVNLSLLQIIKENLSRKFDQASVPFFTNDYNIL